MAPEHQVGFDAMQRLNLRIPDDLKEAMLRECERQEVVSMSEFVRTAIVSHIAWLRGQRTVPNELNDEGPAETGPSDPS